MAHEVIMPALGMTQETGLILAWRKAPGDRVQAGEILMEVETDKAAMEIEAQASGFLTEIRAGEGVEVPVGDVIAIISETAALVVQTAAQEKAAAAPPPESRPEPQPVPATATAPLPRTASAKPFEPYPEAQAVNGKVLASPKARRLAAERGLDLSRLAKAGHRQPFHVADLKTLAAMPGPAAAQASGASRIMARASVASDRFDAFCRWAEREAETTVGIILSAFAAGSLRAATGAAALTVLVKAPRKQPRSYADPDRTGLGRVAPVEEARAPDLIVHDLTGTRLTDAELAAANAPALTVARDDGRFAITLSAFADQLDDDRLVACLDAFAGRLEEPLRQLI